MRSDELADYLRDKLGEKVTDASVAYGQLTITVAPEALPDAARVCKEDERVGCEFFDFMSGVDIKEEGFAVVTNLYSLEHRHHVRLRAVAPGGREAPTLPTLTGIYAGANWHEREAYDMFGIVFEGHPGLEPRILTVENFEGWPLRKDFLLSSREAKPWPGSKDPEDSKVTAPSTTEGGAEQPEQQEDKAAAAKDRAERAKQKAAEMRAKKARERAEAEGSASGTPEGAAAEGSTGADAASEEAVEAEPEGEAKPDAQAEAAAETHGGDTTGEAKAQSAAAEGEQEVQTPEGAAEVAGSDIAGDAAAGTVGGDTAAGATQDAPGSEEPVEDLEAEAKVGQGGKAEPGGSPGVTSQGLEAGDEPEPPPGVAPEDAPDPESHKADDADTEAPDTEAHDGADASADASADESQDASDKRDEQ